MYVSQGRCLSWTGPASRPSLPSLPARPSRFARTLVRTSEEDTVGVADLLARDRPDTLLKPNPAWSTTPQAPVAAPSGEAPRPGKELMKSRKQRREKAAEAVLAAGSEDSQKPKKCKEAIDTGLQLFKAASYKEAIDMFTLALELPGNGAYRLPSSPREYACPSDAEEQAALYNMACCYVKLGQKSSALTCLEAVIEAGFQDWATMRSDSDLQVLGADLQALISKYDNPVATAASALGGMVNGLRGQQEQISDPNSRKPWLLRGMWW